ncbi:MAG: UvrD-helicase domain-containing protein [Clostridia bacterium]|nr:UvrD-helicase domain-containing protein [Clostridia bacterium]
MAKFEPNEEQKVFLESTGSNVLVSASAGSGKTSTMIQKLVKILLEERVPVTSLLVVTYTNAAASEIRLRLYNEISSLVSEVDQDKGAFLKEQLEKLDNAEIGTLHAICRKLLVKYFYEVEESPDFGLLIDKEQKYLLDVALKNIINKYIFSSDETFFDLYECYNSKRNDVSLKKMILQMYEYKLAKVDYLSWKEKFLQGSYHLDINQNSACDYILEHYRQLFLSLSSDIVRLKKIASSSGYAKYENFLELKYQFINAFTTASTNEMAIKLLNETSFPNKPTMSKNADVDEQVFCEELEFFNGLFTEYFKSIKEDFGAETLEDIVNNILKARNNVEKLLEVTEELEKEYSSLKKKKNVLDFNDLETKMLKLLESEQIRNALMEQYKYVFVDEYQDINDKQEAILLKMVSGNNYYMIGDVKQSIYAFRQSSPKIFVSKYNDFSHSDQGKLINFNKNYRSDRNILEFANSVFDNIITSQTIGIDYRNDARFESCKEYKDCSVQLNIINDSKELDDRDELEAQLIAKEILRLLQTKKENGQNFDYGDIAIILRKRGDFVKKLTNLLIGLQIPIKASVTSDFFSSMEIVLLINILKTISNYQDDVALSTVLKNLFNVSDDELLEIRRVGINEKFYNCVKSYSGNESICEKISEFFAFVDDSRKRLLTMTLRDYLHYVITEFDIINKFLCQKDGTKRESNIIEFIRLADNDNYKYSLDKFLEYLEFVSKESVLQGVGTEGNAVEICTIHHSKGLEYPAVILGGLGKRFQLNKDSSDIVINGEFGVGLKSIDSTKRVLSETIIRSACKLNNIKSEIDEEIRLLYVAMTRPKEQLSLIGTFNLEKLHTLKRKPIYSMRNYYEMILRAVERSDIDLFLSKSEFVLNEGCSNVTKVRIYSQDDFEDLQEEKKNDIIISAVDDGVVKKLEQCYATNIETSSVAIKNTVTNILREEVDYENLSYSSRLIDKQDGNSSIDFLKLGTAYHTVMQEVCYNESMQEVESLISRLVAEGKIEESLQKFIRKEDVLKAIEVIAPLIKESTAVWREKQFLLCENYNKLVKSTDNNTKVIVQGVIDLIVEKPYDVCIIDFKTNRGVSEKVLISEYSLQLDLYSKAFSDATGKKVNHKYLYSFALGKLIEVG